MKTLTKFVIFSFAMLIAYTITSQVIAVITGGAELSTLTGCFFAAFGGEVLACALIKIFKLKGDTSDGDSSDVTGDLQRNDDDDHAGNKDDGGVG